MWNTIFAFIRPFIPGKIFTLLQSPYHWLISLTSALVFGFPSRKVKVIAVTGTKGKSSTVEILSAILEEAGFKTALTNTIRFKIGQDSEENLYKMSMPGRFFIQKFISKAVKAECDYVILEMTSQGVLLHRHRFIDLDALVFTNLAPEHIEAHGSYEKYIESKVSLARMLSSSDKNNRTMIVNSDDLEAHRFLKCPSDQQLTYSVHDVEPFLIKDEGIEFTFAGRKVYSSLSGLFNLYNILGAATAARGFGISEEMIIHAIEKFNGIPGRVQKIEAGQDFSVIVDYAHTPDSLEKLYQTFNSARKICVLSGTGGGRDTWKRPAMGSIADAHCDEIILTDEDPYDEDPHKIVEDIAKGIKNLKPTIILERREAIREAVSKARSGDVVLITGKGTDPYIMGPNDTKIPWSDAKVAEEELLKLGGKTVNTAGSTSL